MAPANPPVPTTRQSAPHDPSFLPSSSTFRDSLPKRIQSTRREWMHADTFSDRLYGGKPSNSRNLSAVVIDHDVELTDAHPRSVKSADTLSLHPHSAAEHADGELSYLEDASAGSYSGYDTPNDREGPPSTVYRVESVSMAPSIISSSSISTLNTPSLVSGPTVSSDHSSHEPSPIIGAQLLVADEQTLADAESTSSFASASYAHHYNTQQDPLVCPCWFLDCGFRTGEQDAWERHAITHFRGKSLPHTALCSICKLQFTTPLHTFPPDGASAWSQKMRCLANHLLQGWILADSEPDFELFRYLWINHIIGMEDYTELKTRHKLTHEPRTYRTSEGRARRRAEMSRTTLRR